MNKKEADKAHEVLEIFQDLIIAIGKKLCEQLTDDQRDYVIDKCSDEFRFWRIKD